jgi:hypothetical protein
MDSTPCVKRILVSVRQYCPAAIGLLQGWLRGMLACNMRVFSFTPAMVVASTLRAERDVRLKMPQSVHALGARHVHCASTTCVCPSLHDVLVQGFAIRITTHSFLVSHNTYVKLPMLPLWCMH